MIECPACTFKNLPGTEECDECQTPLPSPITDQNTLSQRSVEATLKEAGIRSPIAVTPSTSTRDVIQKMKQANVGCALVVENAELAGILTERDVLHRLAKPNIDLDDIEVRYVMTPAPETLKDTDSVAYALHAMALGNYRHAIVQKTEGGFGIFSVRDALRFFF